MTEYLNSVEWQAARAELNASVANSVSAVNPDIAVKGSFARGDFHLSRDGVRSYSDVDCLLADNRIDRHAWESRIRAELLKQGYELRISVQNFNPLHGLNMSQSRLLALGELVRFYNVSESPEFRSYLFAKTTLTVLRSVPDGTSRKRAAEDAIERAYVARIGWGDQFTRGSAIGALDSHASADESIVCQMDLLSSGQIDSAREWFLSELPNRKIHPWLSARMYQLVSGQAE